MFRFVQIFCIILAFSTGTTFAQDLKIGYVDFARVMEQMPQSDEASKTLDSEFTHRDKEIVSMQKELIKLEDKHKKDATVMSNTRLKKLEREIISLRRDIKRARQEFNEDFSLRRTEEISKLQNLIYEKTLEVAKEEQYDLILRDSVLFSSKRIDITSKVLEKLRQQPKVLPGKSSKKK